MSCRVSAGVALQLLQQHADWTGDESYRIAPATLRSWVYPGHITCTSAVTTSTAGRPPVATRSARLLDRRSARAQG